MSTPFARPPSAPHVTPAQTRIAVMVHAGLSNREIVEMTKLSLSTVKNHINALYKTGPVNRRELRAVCEQGELGVPGALRPEQYRSAQP